MKRGKRVFSMAAAITLLAGSISFPSVSQGAENGLKKFDAQTTLWTDTCVEEVLGETAATTYGNLAEVNPNADSKNSSGHQNPYGKSGETLTDWAYSEYLWTYSYPVGNGRMAGMVAGGVDKEVIQINEDTIWDGSPYGTITDENGNTITNIDDTAKATTISTKNQTSGSVADGWKFYRGANEDGTPAAIGSANAIVGDEAFRQAYPEFSKMSISYQSLNIDNSKTQEAVQYRYSMERMVESTVLGEPSSQHAYKSFVEVYLDFGQKHENTSNYTKSLDLTKGIVTVDYDYENAHFTRETFASYPDQAVVTHISSTKGLSFSAQLHSYHNAEGRYKYEKVSDKEVKLTAAVSDGNKNSTVPSQINAIQFEAHMLLDGDGVFSVSDDNTTVTVTGGKEAVIYVVGASNYVDYLNLDNTKPASDCARYIKNIQSKTYETIKARHLEDFCPLFAETSLYLENANGVDYSTTPTEERVRKDINGESGFTVGAGSNLDYAHKTSNVYSTYSEGDNQLAVLEFNYGKYLIISGSRDGEEAETSEDIDIYESQPLNLTGKWNAALSASWKGKYTVNINTQMNYWEAQGLGLSTCERPLIDTFDELAQSGSITAANQYAIYNERGDDTYQPGDPWVTHHNFDLWRGTQPIDNATAGLWPTGGIWLLDHAWQYYQYNFDTEYLSEVYPYMVGAAKFFTQFVVVDEKTGYLVTAASCSPEQGGVQPGAAMDTQLIRNLYDMVTKASEILGKTEENKELLAVIDKQMPSTYLGDEKGTVAPNLIDNSGLIKEWARGDVTFDISKSSSPTWNVVNPFAADPTQAIGVYAHGASNASGHRHCSHLLEMYPGTHLSAYSEDENEQAIYEAFCKSVAARGAGSGQGWGLAWRISLNARALGGDAASSMLEQLFTTRTSPNLFDQHPNFQIDGNYGATAGILEMLIQSHDGAIDLLPALPSQWTEGSYSGFKARGGASVDCSWKNGVADSAAVTPSQDGTVNVRYDYIAKTQVIDSNGNVIKTQLNEAENMITFEGKAGVTYTISGFGKNEPEFIEGSWTADVSKATGFFNTEAGKALPKLENSNTNVGYVYNNAYNTTVEDKEVGSVGFAYPDCDVTGLTRLSINCARKAKNGSQYVSIRLDDKDGTEIAKAQITASSYTDLEMEVTIPEGVSGKHKLYAVVTSVGTTTDKYIANFKDLKGYYMYSNPDYVGDDAVVSLIASVVPGTYRELREIELYSKADGVKIYYTTDGSDPKTSATKVLYTEKIQLKGEAGKSVTTTIKAYAVNADLVESDVAEYVYVIELPENTFTGVAADENGSLHYYENGKIVEKYNGMASDENGRRYWFDYGTVSRDKQVYDPVSDGWYWFDADGTLAVDKDVYVPESNENRENGKWVRYDSEGKMVKGEDYRYNGWYRFDEITGEMIKGWYTTENGTVYYYNDITGQMEHGAVVIDGKPCAFDKVTGVGIDCEWYTIDGNEYWYELGVRQGLEGRGKEIYDPKSDAWYWLDSIDGGKKAVSKDVYQDSNGGKWVRYDEDGHMVKGWTANSNGRYYFDLITGAMMKGLVNINGTNHYFDEITGINIY